MSEVDLHWLLSATGGKPGLYLYVVVVFGMILLAIVGAPTAWVEIRAKLQRKRE